MKRKTGATKMNAIATSLIVSNFEGKPISTRSDGYWNATEMCEAYGKRIDNFLRLDGTKAYLKAFDKLHGNSLTSEVSQTPLEQDFGKLTSEVSQAPSEQGGEKSLTSEGVAKAILQKRGGRGEQGTWVHPQVALKLAAWLNPEFEVWVYATIEKLFRTGEVKLKDEIAGLQSALNQASKTIEEYDMELALRQHEKDKLKRDYLEAVCLSEGDYSDYLEDPECYQSN